MDSLPKKKHWKASRCEFVVSTLVEMGRPYLLEEAWQDFAFELAIDESLESAAFKRHTNLLTVHPHTCDEQ
jgi:hypothetical protein